MSGEPLLTLDELCARVALALSEDYDGAPNERVREVPDRRTIRYYTTLGLIDRPADMHGRTALYGRRHLLQLVAIKRLQSRGESLHEIQQRLLGLSDADLAKLARVPNWPEESPEPRTREPKRRSDFWKTSPGPTAAPPAELADAPVLQGVPLGAGAMLLLPLRRAPDEFDLEAIRIAAAPLLRLLQSRRLVE